MARRVLVVDDSLLMRRMITDALSICGWELAGEASSGDEAVRAFVETRPDLVTLDLVMPGTNGMPALERIMAIEPNAKVIVISALNQTKLISEAIRKGAQDFVAKPFMPEQIQATVQACFEEMPA
jgi:two-component system chemotaxis response regulator CheY